MLPAELQVGRRAARPRRQPASLPGRGSDRRDGWLLTTGSGLPAGYGKGPREGPSLLRRARVAVASEGWPPRVKAARGGRRGSWGENHHICPRARLNGLAGAGLGEKQGTRGPMASATRKKKKT